MKNYNRDSLVWGAEEDNWLSSVSSLIMLQELNKSDLDGFKESLEKIDKSSFKYVVQYKDSKQEYTLSSNGAEWLEYEASEKLYAKWWTRKQLTMFRSFYKSVKK